MLCLSSTVAPNFNTVTRYFQLNPFDQCPKISICSSLSDQISRGKDQNDREQASTSFNYVHTFLSPNSLELFKTFIILCVLYCLIGQVASRCEKSTVQVGSSRYDVCQMCYFQFGTRFYFLKCNKKYNCQSLSSSNDQNFDLFSQFFHNHHNLCQKTTQTIYDSRQCQALCCDQFKSSKNSYNQAEQGIYTNEYCKEMSSSKSKTIILIALIVSIPVFCLLFCILFNYFFRRRQQNEALGGDFGQGTESFIKQNEIHVSKIDIQLQGPSCSNPDETCAICLDDNCNTYTNCGHYYHPKCLRDWLAKRPRCPVCMSKKYNPVKLYCKKCKKQVKLDVFRRQSLTEAEIKNIDSLERLFCDNCLSLKMASQPQEMSEIKTHPETKLNELQKKRVDVKEQDEQHVSILQFSEDIKHSPSKNIEDKFSLTMFNINSERDHQVRKNFDQSVQQYMRAFKSRKEKQKISSQSKESFPKNEGQNFVHSNETPQKLFIKNKFESNQNHSST